MWLVTTPAPSDTFFMPELSKFLAFDTSTDRMSVALTDGQRTWQHDGPGGAQASTTLIPAVMGLLAGAGLALGDLDAVVFGRGPGSFTGLRTACAVAQGLAFGANHGAGIPVLPVDTLLAVAEEARLQAGGDVTHITALIDARMDEMYTQRFVVSGGVCTGLDECTLVRPEKFVPPAGDLLAGNVFTVYAGRLPDLSGFQTLIALPTATALLRLAPALAAAGGFVDAALALPLYVRDKVALTTDERAQVKADKALLTAAITPTTPHPA